MIFSNGNIRRTAVTLLLGAALTGCSKGPKLDATVEGSVTVDGELADRGTVTFSPAKSGPAATGRIFENGSYRVGTGLGDVSNADGGKLPVGEYVVTVLVSGESPEDGVVAKGGPPLSGPRLSAAKYMDKSTSDLKFTVEKGRNVIDLALVGASADPPPPEDEEQGKEDADEASTADKGVASQGASDEASGSGAADEEARSDGAEADVPQGADDTNQDAGANGDDAAASTTEGETPATSPPGADDSEPKAGEKAR